MKSVSDITKAGVSAFEDQFLPAPDFPSEVISGFVYLGFNSINGEGLIQRQNIETFETQSVTTDDIAADWLIKTTLDYV